MLFIYNFLTTYFLVYAHFSSINNIVFLPYKKTAIALLMLIIQCLHVLVSGGPPPPGLLRADSPDTTSPLNLSVRREPRRIKLEREDDEDEDEDEEEDEEEEEEEEGAVRSSHSTPSPAATSLGWLPGGGGGGGRPSLWSSPSLVEPTRRIWSPAIACEQESKQQLAHHHHHNNNNKNISSSSMASSSSTSSVMVKVEVVCGDCGGMASSKYRPDVRARCEACSSGHTRPDRSFPVSKF